MLILGSTIKFNRSFMTYTITNTLSNCTTNNSSISIHDSSEYSATITADNGYTLNGATISITMGGVDITSTAYSDGVIYIPSVVGNIVIEISAVEYIVPTEDPFITFSGPDQFDINVYNPVWDGTVEYSTDKSTWNVWDGTTLNSSLNAGTGLEELYLRGTGNTVISAYEDPSTYQINYGPFNIACESRSVDISGNIETLLDYQSVQNGIHPPVGSNCFRRMFYQCGRIYDCSSLKLKTLITTYACYRQMFESSSIVYAPQIYATDFAERCCQNMFGDCWLLETLPEIVALTFASRSCNSMFISCSNIYLAENNEQSEYANEYRIPSSGEATANSNWGSSMFSQTSGIFTGTPTINTTYYTINEINRNPNN